MSFLRRRNLSSKKRFHTVMTTGVQMGRWWHAQTLTWIAQSCIPLTIHLNLNLMSGPGRRTLFLFPVCTLNKFPFSVFTITLCLIDLLRTDGCAIYYSRQSTDSESTTLLVWKWPPLFLTTQVECPKFARLCTIQDN